MPLKSSISSHVRISYRFYEFVTTRYTTDFYIIKVNKSQNTTLSPRVNQSFLDKNELITMREISILVPYFVLNGTK